MAMAEGDYDAVSGFESVYGLRLLATVATAISFLSWSFRAHANLRGMGRQGVRHSDQATIWWWIVPIAFLFMPFRVMYETVRGSTASEEDPGWRASRLDTSAGWWTTLLIGGGVLSGFTNALLTNAASTSDLAGAFNSYAASVVVLAFAAFAGMAVITKVTQTQARWSRWNDQRLFAHTHQGQTTSLGGAPTGPIDLQVSTALATTPIQQTADFSLYCRRCGSKYVSNDDRFCGQCGALR